MAGTIEAVRIVTDEATPDDDAWFIELQGAGKAGWYGPVNAAVGQYAGMVLADVVAGESTEDHRRLHAALCDATAGDTTAVASWAVGAVDCAAWDLHGQLVQEPVAQLLAASPQWAVPLYASWLSLDISSPTPVGTVKQVGREGWRFTKWGLRKGLEKDPGIEADRLAAMIRAVAAALGEAAAFDAIFTWDATLADLVAGQVERGNVLWLEDPLRNCDLEAYRSLASKIPLGVGEQLLVHADGQALLSLQLRAFTLDVVACGGLTRAVDLVTAAYARGISAYPHGRSFVPAVHLAAAYPSVIPAVEYRLQWEPVRQQRYACPWLPTQGTITLPKSPGLGTRPRSH
jgi:L-alanine-DL-glutamate epimerase-like enolase superfamily enzyme